MNVRECDENTIRIEHDYHWSTDLEQALYEITDHRYSQPRYWGDHGTDIIEIEKENPLYGCFKYMVLCAKRKELKQYGKDYSNIEILINQYPSSANEKTVELAKEHIKNVNIMRENQKRLDEEAENERRKQIFETEKAEKETIITLSNLYPIAENSRFKVRICWSEHPAFYDWEDDELELSLMAADLIFKKLDKKLEDGGYHKTKFMIIENNDEENAYTGRYDLGEEEDGLFNHLVKFAEYCLKNNIENVKEFMDYINNVIADAANNQPEISLANGFNDFVEKFKRNK